MKKPKGNRRVALFMQNRDCEDLVKRKIYRVLSDSRAESGFIQDFGNTWTLR
jgi:hypothetical protein